MKQEINRYQDSLEFDVVFYLMDQRRKKIDLCLRSLCSMEINHLEKKQTENKKIHSPTNIWNKIFHKKTIYKSGEIKWKL